MCVCKTQFSSLFHTFYLTHLTVLFRHKAHDASPPCHRGHGARKADGPPPPSLNRKSASETCILWEASCRKPIQACLHVGGRILGWCCLNQRGRLCWWHLRHAWKDVLEVKHHAWRWTSTLLVLKPHFSSGKDGRVFMSSTEGGIHSHLIPKWVPVRSHA